MSGDLVGRSLLEWFRRHGRTDLPWQRDPTPYRVWVSEIMLQQTRVETVVRYYGRFTARFPDVRHLAAAGIDEVLHLWSGLGYYARARNLHRAAGIVCEQHGGELPAEMEALVRLPGIGRSTAGAILTLACGQRHPILDGNVKRVLCRFHGIEGWPAATKIEKELWALAGQHTPDARTAEYTQAIMDLGATVCTRRRPRCDACPLHRHCRARLQGREASLPTPRPARPLPVRSTVFLVLRAPDGGVLLERRPPAGVWGGLWGFPELAPGADVDTWCRRRLGSAPCSLRALAPLRHTFSHFHLDITPLLAEVPKPQDSVMEWERWLWYKSSEPVECGLAAPVARLLSEIQNLAIESTPGRREWRGP